MGSFSKKIQRFNDAYKDFRQAALSGNVEYIAGDCPLEDIEKWIDDLESNIFLNCYFRCKSCGKIFWVGAYCRGGPGCLIRKGVPGLDSPCHTDYWGESKADQFFTRKEDRKGKHGTWQTKKEWKKNKKQKE